MPHDHNAHLQAPAGVSSLKFKFILYKRYFEMGYSITGYVKFMIAIFGISSLNVAATIIMGILYAFACFAVGWAWFRYGFMELDTEITNQYNSFVKEMRATIKTPPKPKS